MTLIGRKDFPHGMPTTQADTINADLLWRSQEHAVSLPLCGSDASSEHQPAAIVRNRRMFAAIPNL